jgi:hypothetical protein
MKLTAHLTVCLLTALVASGCEQKQVKPQPPASKEAAELIAFVAPDKSIVLGMARHYPRPTAGMLSEHLFSCLERADTRVIAAAHARAFDARFAGDSAQDKAALALIRACEAR